MIDVILLRVMRRRSDFYKLIDLIDVASMENDVQIMLKNFGKYFDKFPSHDEVQLQTFVTRMKAWYPKAADTEINKYARMMQTAMEPPDEDQRANILSELSELKLMTKLANLADKHQQGDLADAFSEITLALEDHRSRANIKVAKYIDTEIDELLQDEFDDTGIAWRLGCLNASMRKLRPGDFGIVAGRPDKGKTTFLSNEITNFAPQLPPDRNIVWLNNEGPGRRIIPRLYQSALNLTMTEMKELQSSGTLVENYRTQIGGRLDKIRIVDIHGYNTGQVEAILEDSNPGVIVYDMIDNIRGFGDQPRTDLVLEKMYQWARERSVKYDCIGIATSQISNDGDGMQFPTLGMLKDSKTGKQGACDFQIMIGASNDVGLSGSRFIGLPKNKLRRPDGPSDPRAEVIFDAVRARYRDIDVGS